MLIRNCKSRLVLVLAIIGVFIVNLLYLCGIHNYFGIFSSEKTTQKSNLRSSNVYQKLIKNHHDIHKEHDDHSGFDVTQSIKTTTSLQTPNLHNKNIHKAPKYHGFHDVEEIERWLDSKTNQNFQTHDDELDDVQRPINTKLIDLNSSIVVPILRRDNYLRDCVTGISIGNLDRTVKTHDLSGNPMSGESFEGTKARVKSFEFVYESKAWGHDWDSIHTGPDVSGRGATLDWAQEVIATLHSVINYIKLHQNKVTISLLDLPCGDMAWMSRFLKTRDDIIYTGIDIVKQLIDSHKKNYASFRNWRFIHADALDDSVKIQQYDLILSRTLLQHLYNRDIVKIMQKMSQSGAAYLLTTTFANHNDNKELVIDKDNPGRFRKINLQLPPFNISAPLCLHRDGPIEILEGQEHFIGLWKLPLQIIDSCEETSLKAPPISLELFGCDYLQ